MSHRHLAHYRSLPDAELRAALAVCRRIYVSSNDLARTTMTRLCRRQADEDYGIWLACRQAARERGLEDDDEAATARFDAPP